MYKYLRGGILQALEVIYNQVGKGITRRFHQVTALLHLLETSGDFILYAGFKLFQRQLNKLKIIFSRIKGKGIIQAVRSCPLTHPEDFAAPLARWRAQYRQTTPTTRSQHYYEKCKFVKRTF